jgi:hypothetical protein
MCQRGDAAFRMSFIERDKQRRKEAAHERRPDIRWIKRIKRIEAQGPIQGREEQSVTRQAG